MNDWNLTETHTVSYSSNETLQSVDKFKGFKGKRNTVTPAIEQKKEGELNLKR